MSERDAMSALLALYAEADEETIRHGRGWYDRARRECRKIARETGYTVRQVAAVMAITSPDAQLSQNVRWTREACASNGRAKVGRYPAAMGDKVRRALKDRRDPGQYATGPKVNAFYRAITGDESALVIDRWAAFAAGAGKVVPGANLRRALEAAYRAAAEAVGETVAAFQAIVWTIIRRRAERVNGSAVRYADI